MGNQKSKSLEETSSFLKEVKLFAVGEDGYDF